MNPFEKYFQRNVVTGDIPFPDDLAVVVIIPVFDDRDVFRTLESLAGCRCEQGKTGVLVIVNHSEKCEEEIKTRNRELAEELKNWVTCRKVSGMWFGIMEAFDLPAKSAGVGLARKIAMDQAAAYFWRSGRTECPIASLDADTWVEPGYPDEIVRYFREFRVAGVSIAYAHRLDEPECSGAIREAIIKYELYLRYYQQALKYIGHPYAYSCIGSAFAVRAADYVAQGGMNKRQAGEDFYFLQKLIATGRYSSLSATTVYPSARFSTRTPFGTGQAVRQIAGDGGAYLTYHFDAFRMLKSFFAGIRSLYKDNNTVAEDYFCRQPLGLRDFLFENGWVALMAEINANCASESQFVKRFFDNFNAFQVLKYLNFVHPRFFPKTDIMQVTGVLLRELELPCPLLPVEVLELMRRL